MSVEEALKDAMRAHVADVQAAPTLGGAIRRRHRTHVLRFRTAGAALVTAAVAVAVPVALTSSDPGNKVATGSDRAVIATVKVPDVTGMTLEEATSTLKQAVVLVKLTTGKPDEHSQDLVTGQDPAAGAEVAPGTQVTLTVKAPTDDNKPQDLGDLGDGRTFGGIHLDYVPDGLAWGKWSGKDGFGVHSYTTSFDLPDNPDGYYGVQVVVYQGEAAKLIRGRVGKLKGAEKVDVNGRPGYLAMFGEASEVVSDGGTRTIGWMLRDDLAVEAMISPDYAKKVDADAELKKVAEGIKPTE
ncbi:PASTA domain-containing protein [Nonomuraea sediminis]|uniref:PASTA domain-containing protein n=1 Tax=Nonomuraea sediminis TaxID=2835864 RepID=UPI001BDD6651|nr:PASTA domain-containing protein [Nonomuraea sediminis]